jgi:hypothetical protein
MEPILFSGWRLKRGYGWMSDTAPDTLKSNLESLKQNNILDIYFLSSNNSLCIFANSFGVCAAMSFGYVLYQPQLESLAVSCHSSRYRFAAFRSQSCFPLPSSFRIYSGISGSATLLPGPGFGNAKAPGIGRAGMPGIILCPIFRQQVTDACEMFCIVSNER